MHTVVKADVVDDGKHKAYQGGVAELAQDRQKIALLHHKAAVFICPRKR